MYLLSEQRCAVTYSLCVTVCFSCNIFMSLFVTRLSSMYKGMCMVDYKVGYMSMYKGQSDKVAGGVPLLDPKSPSP